jgi:hypothetical protein
MLLATATLLRDHRATMSEIHRFLRGFSERLGCHFCECIDVGIAGGEQGGDDSLPPLGEVIAMCGACFT